MQVPLGVRGDQLSGLCALNKDATFTVQAPVPKEGEWVTFQNEERH